MNPPQPILKGFVLKTFLSRNLTVARCNVHVQAAESACCDNSYRVRYDHHRLKPLPLPPSLLSPFPSLPCSFFVSISLPLSHSFFLSNSRDLPFISFCLSLPLSTEPSIIFLSLYYLVIFLIFLTFIFISLLFLSLPLLPSLSLSHTGHPDICSIN